MTATTELKSIRLEAQSASGKKFYQIKINPQDAGFTVDFVHGAVGGSIRTGTKTTAPVSLEAAEKIFNRLQKEKETGDSQYRPVEPGGNVIVMTPKAAAPAEELPICIPPRLLRDIEPGQIELMTTLDNWVVQLKHDGDRVQVHARNGKVTLFSGRSGKTRPCPSAIEKAVLSMNMDLAIDGELVEQVLWSFDVLSFDGVDARRTSYRERRQVLAEMIHEMDCQTLRLVVTAEGEAMKRTLIAAAQEAQAEGVVFVNDNAPYTSGRPSRGGDNLRLKFVETGFFIVHEHRPDGKDSFSVRLHGAKEAIGTCSAKGKDMVPVGTVIEAKYLYVQSKLVQPRLHRIRTDIPHYFCNRKQLRFKDGIDPMKAGAR